MNINVKRLSLVEVITIAVVILAMVIAISRSSLFADLPSDDQTKREPITQKNTISARWNQEAAQEVKRTQASPKISDTESVDDSNSPEHSSSLSQLLTPETILSYVSQTRLDENGNVILDDRTLTYLRSSLNQIPTKLTEIDKQYLHQVLSQGIGGAEGVKAADIVLSYYDYMEVKKELLSDAMASNNLLANPEALSNINSRIEALQYSYFDADVADQLFYKENMDTRFSYELHALQQNTVLDNDEKRSAYQELKEKYHQSQPPISQWEYKKSLFNQEKSTLEQQNEMHQSEDHEQELQKALERHFSERELLVLQDYKIDLINPAETSEEVMEILFIDEVEPESVATTEGQSNTDQ